VKYVAAARRYFGKFVSRDEGGASLPEYAFLLALIAIICVVAIASLGNKISSMYDNVATSI